MRYARTNAGLAIQPVQRAGAGHPAQSPHCSTTPGSGSDPEYQGASELWVALGALHPPHSLIEA